MPNAISKSPSKKQIDKRLMALGKVITVIAHELKSPLSGIISLSKAILDKQNIEPKFREYLDLIYKGALDCEGLVRNIMLFTKQAQPSPSASEIDLKDLILKWTDYITKLHSRVESYFPDIKIEQRHQDVLPVVMMDEMQAKEIFTNLMLNSIDAVKNIQGPKIIVETKSDQRNVYLVVEDNGEGIDESNMDKIFTPFFSTKEKGIGLGLTVVRDIAEKNNGSVIVESQKNKGTTVTIKFPVRER